MANDDFTQMANESAREIPPDVNGAETDRIEARRLEHLLCVLERESVFCGALSRTAALSSYVDGDDWRRIFELIAEHANVMETVFRCYHDGSPYPAY
jgi:hypothetical protein